MQFGVNQLRLGQILHLRFECLETAFDEHYFYACSCGLQSDRYAGGPAPTIASEVVIFAPPCMRSTGVIIGGHHLI